MNAFNPLPTDNRKHGFWGTCRISHIPVRAAWREASLFLAERYNLSPLETRDFLDSKPGRWLADEISDTRPVPKTVLEIQEALEKARDLSGEIQIILSELGIDKLISRKPKTIEGPC